MKCWHTSSTTRLNMEINAIDSGRALKLPATAVQVQAPAAVMVNHFTAELLTGAWCGDDIFITQAPTLREVAQTLTRTGQSPNHLAIRAHFGDGSSRIVPASIYSQPRIKTERLPCWIAAVLAWLLPSKWRPLSEIPELWPRNHVLPCTPVE